MWDRDWWGAPVHVALILVLGFLGLFLVRRLITHATDRVAQTVSEGPDDPERRATRARTVGSVLRSAANLAFGVVMGLMILYAVGLEEVVAPLLASAGVVGVAIGFGAQSLVRDYISGIFILIEDQFGVGDRVDLGFGVTGVVEAMDLRLTHVRAFDGTLWHVRNGEILRAGNQTQQWNRAVAEVRVPVGTDLNVANEVLTRAVAQVFADDPEEFLEAPALHAMDSLTDGTYSFTLHAKVLPGRDFAVQRKLLAAAQQELTAAGILGD